MQPSWLTRNSLLADYVVSLYDKADNTKIAYLLDVCIYFRELFTHFWEFPPKYTIIARDIAAAYFQRDIPRPSAALLSPQRQLALPTPLTSKLKLAKRNGRVCMDLAPCAESSLEDLVRISRKDVALLNVAFAQHRERLDAEFFEDAFRYEKWAQIMNYFREQRKNNSTTLARRWTALKGFERYLYQAELVPEMQIPHYPRPKEIRKLQPALSESEMLDLLDGIKPQPAGSRHQQLSIRNRAMLELLYGTGIRASELVDLRVGDIDVRHCTVRIRNAKGGHFREIAIPQGIVPFLELYEQHRDTLFRESPAKHTYYFPSQQKHRMNRRTLFRVIRKYTTSVGISPHSFRRSAAIHLLEHRATVAEVQHYLGHRRMASTFRYLEFSPVELPEVLRKYHPRGR